jgi:hypothetical protein
MYRLRYDANAWAAFGPIADKAQTDGCRVDRLHTLRRRHCAPLTRAQGPGKRQQDIAKRRNRHLGYPVLRWRMGCYWQARPLWAVGRARCRQSQASCGRVIGGARVVDPAPDFEVDWLLVPSSLLDIGAVPCASRHDPPSEVDGLSVSSRRGPTDCFDSGVQHVGVRQMATSTEASGAFVREEFAAQAGRPARTAVPWGRAGRRPGGGGDCRGAGGS